MRHKEIWVKDLSPGMTLSDMFVVAELRSGPQPSGKQPLKFNLRDKTGIVRAHMWCDDVNQYRQLYGLVKRAYEDERVVLAEGTVKSYRDENDFEVRRIEILDEGSFQDFPGVDSMEDEEIARLERELLALVERRLAEARNDRDAAFARKILEAFLGDEGFMRAFRVAPGARFYHHARRGGLLEHTYNVARLATGTASLFNKTYDNPVSVPLVLAGAVLHDIGKMDAYTLSRRDIRDTYEGRATGHIFLGMLRVHEKARTIFSAGDMEKLPALLHIIASHHGHAEFGAPVEPVFPEAFIVFYADDLDAKLEHISRTMGQELPGYSVMLKRFLYPPRRWREEGSV